MIPHTLDPSSLDEVLAPPGPDAPGRDRTELRQATWQGEPVLTKSGTGRHRAALRREAAALTRIGAPVAAELIDLHDDEDRTTLVLEHVGQATLADPESLAPEVLLRTLQRTCESLEELHRAGWYHGRLSPDHVVVGARGRVRFCSLAAAGPSGGRDDEVQRDLEALLAICDDLVARLAPDHRALARRLQRTVADQRAREGGPNALELAAAIRSIRQHGSGRRISRPRPGLVATLARAGAGVLGAGALVVLTQLGRDATLPVLHASSDGPTVEALDTAPAPPDPSWGTPLPDSADPPSDPGAPVVQLGDADYRVGRHGDLPALGDWDCDGTAGLRLLRPSTGELFQFDQMATAGRPVHGRVIAEIPGAMELRVLLGAGTTRSQGPGEDTGDCDRTEVLDASGSWTEVP